MTYYHGTSLINAEKIVKSKNFSLKKTIGTLGIGAYAFEYSKSNAVRFATNKLKRMGMAKRNDSIAVVSFEIDSSKVFDLSDAQNIELFNNFIERKKTEISALSLRFKNGVNGYSKKLDGAIIDSFIDEMIASGFYIQGVKGPTENHFEMIKIKNTGIPNSVELCIKNNKIIDYDTIKLIEGDDLI